MTSLGRVRWSDILVPWLWLAAHEHATPRFAESLAELGRGAYDEFTQSECHQFVERLWLETRFSFRAMGVSSAPALVRCEMHGSQITEAKCSNG